MPFVRSASLISEPFVLVAESFSTPLAIQYAATNPPNLKGVVVCTGFVTSPVRGWRRFIYSLLSPFSFGVAPPEFVTRRLLIGPNAPPLLAASVRAAISMVSPKVLSTRLGLVLACDVRAELRQVTAPILYLQAGQDHLVDSSCLEEILKIKPQTSVTVIAGPHLLFQREPQRSADVVSEYIQQLV